MGFFGGNIWRTHLRMKYWSLKWWRTIPILFMVTLFLWFLLGTYLFSCSNKNCSNLSSKTSHKLTATSKPTSSLSDLNGIEICLSIKFVEPLQTLELSSSPQLGDKGPYSVVYNYLRPSRFYAINDTVTYTTHSTPEFFDNIGTVAERWDGPISVAIYAPFTDFCRAIHRMVYLRNCDKADYREKVSWHIFWIRDSPPPANYMLVPDEIDVDCSKLATDFSTNEDLKNTWRSAQKLPYPVNVARNIARTASSTWFVLPSDVELYPSMDFTSQFMKFIKTTNPHPVKQIILTSESPIDNHLVESPKVYVVPVFEVQKSIPNTKEELMVQYARKTAVYFHKNLCAHCQKFPGLLEWLKTAGKQGTMQAMSWSYRRFPYHRWEPIFVCSKQEPLYEEELTWEGLQDKMSQMHELCLRDYQFHLLDRAFLTHAVGIKRRKRGKPAHEAWRKPFIESNARVYDRVMADFELKYGARDNVCLKH